MSSMFDKTKYAIRGVHKQSGNVVVICPDQSDAGSKNLLRSHKEYHHTIGLRCEGSVSRVYDVIDGSVDLADFSSIWRIKLD